MKERYKMGDDLRLIDCKTKHTLGKIYRPVGVSSGGRRRVLADQKSAASYHVMSRVTGGAYLLGAEEKEAFRRLLWKMARFLGVQIGTYCVMDNHFHILLRIPAKERFISRFKQRQGELTPQPKEHIGVDGRRVRHAELAPWEQRLVKHLRAFYSKSYIAKLSGEIEQMRTAGREGEIAVMLARYRERFCSLQHFVKELKERFSRWFNKKYRRKGTLWMERYKSVLVQDGEALRTMAAYIDLNPVRAGICEAPSDYPWCGYADALAGSKRAKAGLCRILNISARNWEKTASLYRSFLSAREARLEDYPNPARQAGAAKEPLACPAQKDEVNFLIHPLASDSSRKTPMQGNFKHSLLGKLKQLSTGLVFGDADFLRRYGKYLE